LVYFLYFVKDISLIGMF